MIIFGTRGVTYSAGSGEFYCPACQAQMPYRQRRVRRFFTLYFIPLIPLDLHGEYIECQNCRGTYTMEVLNLDPEAGSAEVEAEFHRAVRQVMVDMMLADGAVDDKEVQAIRDIYGQLTGNDISEEEVRVEIGEAQSKRRDMTEFLEQVAGYLNDAGKEMVVKAAFLVAAADGEFHDEEKALIGAIGHSLGMTAAHLNGVISSMVESE